MLDDLVPHYTKSVYSQAENIYFLLKKETTIVDTKRGWNNESVGDKIAHQNHFVINAMLHYALLYK